ncbi:hypothetical protein QJS10_CPB14g00922 [Acorus calamus]|uniref:Reverse transcriptase zinc-binding domain-containing protein n=1 Tax=Acorus calamus TaxID=4465 RepID=A0AAV9DGB6_ACOCL|nr:hypothetical protein QJS10_CPB14g00922 [Acorus calamus]
MATHWGTTDSTPVCKLLDNGTWSPTLRWPACHLAIWEDILMIRVGGSRTDIPIWMGSKTGNLPPKAGWNFLRVHKPLVSWKGWAWDPVQTPRHSYTTWLALLDKLPTLQRLQKQGLLHSTQCPLCFRGSDEVHHLFFKCGYSSFIWLSLLSKLGLPRAIC